jgi:ubiquinone/menaquinone biosynthesis C-methylase UbiE
MAKTKSVIREYWNWRSSTFGLDADKSDTVAGRWASVFQELTVGAPGKRALDVGTGTGQLAMYLSVAGFDVTAVDLSESMISHARRNASSRGLDIDFHAGDAESLDFEDDAFHVVVSRNLLWTLPNPEKAISEWRRVLAPGGRLVISDGFWKNTTWNRLHRLAFKVLKERCRNGSLVSLRFFRSYALLQKKLPLYEGVSLTNAVLFLQKAGFKEIASYDTSLFERYPYGNGIRKRVSPFFIAYATA